MTDKLIEDIVVAGPTRCYRVANAQGKTWILPARNMRTAMALYQPGGRNGKLLKAWLPRLHRVPGVCRYLHAEVLQADLRDDIRRAIADAFGVSDFEWALFGGTPSVHQKITIQIFNGKQLLGYVKLTTSPEIAPYFRHEQEVLGRLEGLSVPRVLMCGKVGGVDIFIQTTRKTLKSKEVHAWTDAHSRFVEQLYRSTAQEVAFADSDYRQVLMAIDPYLPLLPDHQRETIVEARDAVLREYDGKTMTFSVYQGDFTPWNMVVNPDGLFVFDWEYSRVTYPQGLDRWHFIVQTAIFERVLTHDDIEAMLRPHFGDPTLRLYLLDVICRFTVRERGRFPRCMGHSMDLWCRLLRSSIQVSPKG